MKPHLFASTLTIAAISAFATPAKGATTYSNFLNPAFTGTTATDGWFGLNATAFPGYGTFGTAFNAWPAPIGSNQAGSGDAVLNKLPGTSGYLASEATNAIYSPNGLGTFLLSDSSPVAGLSNLLIQVNSTGNIGASAFTLSYNGGSQNLAPTETLLLASGPVNTTFGPATHYLWAYQWDLSSLGAISDFTATWTSAADHDLTFGARMDQSSVYVQVIPEPSALLFVAGAGFAALLRRRRR